MSKNPTIIQRSLYGFSRSTNGTIGAGTSAITCAMFVVLYDFTLKYQAYIVL